MDKVIRAIKCSQCQELLDTPVLLPCHHTICNKHVSGDRLRCANCGVEHEIPAQGFVVVEALCDIISSRIGCIDLGAEHKEATKSCTTLTSYVEYIEYLLNNPSSYSVEKIGLLRNEVHVKCEQLKLKIDAESKKMFDRLDEYESRCKCVHKGDFKANMKSRYELVSKGYRSRLLGWTDELNEIKVDQPRWKLIRQESFTGIQKLNDFMKSLREEILLKEFKNYEREVESFKKISIDSGFVQKKDAATENENDFSLSRVKSSPDLVQNAYANLRLFRQSEPPSGGSSDSDKSNRRSRKSVLGLFSSRLMKNI